MSSHDGVGFAERIERLRTTWRVMTRDCSHSVVYGETHVMWNRREPPGRFMWICGHGGARAPWGCRGGSDGGLPTLDEARRQAREHAATHPDVTAEFCDGTW